MKYVHASTLWWVILTLNAADTLLISPLYVCKIRHDVIFLSFFQLPTESFASNYQGKLLDPSGVL